MPTLSEQVQANIRALTGASGQYIGDWHALFTLAGIPSGQFGERLLAYYKSKYADNPTAASALNYFLLNPSQITAAGGGVNPALLFAAGEQGFWYDPSDFSTLFQDSTGLTPVTAVEQPLGKVLDKSGRGNDAIQAIAANRPVLSARVNLLTKTEDYTVAPWTTSSATRVSTTAIAPDTSNTAASYTFGVNGVFYTSASFSLIAGSPVVTSVWLKASANISFPFLYNGLSNGANNTIYTGGNVPLTNAWQKFTFSATAAGADTGLYMLFGGAGYSGPETVSIWHPQLETRASATTYQRVNTSADYDSVGFPVYIKFNGTNSTMSTGAINFSATNKVSVFTGLRKASDAAQGMVLELSATDVSNAGTFNLQAPIGASATYGFDSKGTVLVPTQATAAAPVTSLITGQGDIGAPSNIIRINGVQQATSAVSQGTGNYGNYPIYIGARGGSSVYFNGDIYSLIVRGAASSASEVNNTETYVNNKTKAF